MNRRLGFKATRLILYNLARVVSGLDFKPCISIFLDSRPKSFISTNPNTTNIVKNIVRTSTN